MIGLKENYLKRITSFLSIQSTSLGKELEGSSPPSVFVGSWNYPKVFAGPMMTPSLGDSMVLDMPELWIPRGMTQRDIINYRLSLVRGKSAVNVYDLNNRFVEKLQEVSLSSNSVTGEAEFSKPPKGVMFSDEYMPYGPSAEITRFDVEGNVRWNHLLEKAYYDTDLKAYDAVNLLHCRGVPFSSIQKAFSVGALGLKNSRRLVPTRWSITACDNAIADSLLKEVRQYDPVDCFRVYEFSSLNNRYVVLFTPTLWQYEWTEAFIHILGREEHVFSDFEMNEGKKGYSKVGGCYYSCKMAVLEALAREKKQAGVFVFREAYRGYIPLGVFNVRENVRHALMNLPQEFEDLSSALKYVGGRLRLPLSRFIGEGTLIKDLGRCRQTTLNCF